MDNNNQNPADQGQGQVPGVPPMGSQPGQIGPQPVQSDQPVQSTTEEQTPQMPQQEPSPMGEAGARAQDVPVAGATVDSTGTNNSSGGSEEGGVPPVAVA